MDLKSDYLPASARGLAVGGTGTHEEHITVPAEALNSVNDQQQCIHVHLNEPAKVKIMCTAPQDLPKCSQNNFNKALGDGKMLTKWFNKVFPKAYSVYIAIGIFIGWVFLAACNLLYPLLVHTRPVPAYNTTLGRFMILGSLSSLILSGMLTQMYLAERKRNHASSGQARSLGSDTGNWPISSFSHNGKIKMTKRNLFDDSQHRIREYKYYFM